MVEVKKYNVYMLGAAFCLVLTGFNTMGGIQTLIFNSKEGFEGNGYTSLAIIYMVFTFANWFAPSIVAMLGPRVTMIIGAFAYAGFIAQLLLLNVYLLYTMSAILGIGAALIWTSQGNFLSNNSNEETISKNSGIFWAMQISSGLIGNIFVYFQFKGKDSIDDSTRNIVGIVLLSVTGVGILALCLLKRAPVSDSQTPPNTSPTKALLDSYKLFLTKDMLLLSVTFFYTGIQLNIWSAVYSTSIGFTKAFEDRKALATISAMLVSVGEITAGAAFGIFGSVTVRRGRDPIIMMGFVLSMIAYFLAFINLPSDSNIEETDKSAFITSNAPLAIFTSFLLGFSDACFNTQIFSILGGTFRDNSASAFAIFKFMQCLAASMAFWYSPYLGLYWQLLIAVVFDVLGTVAFCTVEWRRNKETALAKNEDNTCGLPDDIKAD